jgi:hypothetical protein
MQPDNRPRTVRASITIDIYDQGLLTVLIWARQSAYQLTGQLWEHGILAHVVSVAIDQPRRTP